MSFVDSTFRDSSETFNTVTSDYGEHVVAERLGLKLENNSNKGYDAVDSNNLRYQIKSRRITGKI